MASPALELKSVSKAFRGPQGEVRALQDASLEVPAGDFVAIRGPSGSGKTTLLLLAGGLLKPDTGVVAVAGEDLYAQSAEALARTRAARIGFVFQQFHLVPYLTVLENILTPAVALRTPGAEARADELIERFGLGARRHHVPGQLSTGERQRTALARAFLNQPKLILADEPTGNLDDENGTLVLRALTEFAAAGGAVVLVTHDPRAAVSARRTLRLEAGKFVNGADPADVARASRP